MTPHELGLLVLKVSALMVLVSIVTGAVIGFRNHPHERIAGIELGVLAGALVGIANVAIAWLVGGVLAVIFL